MCENNLYGEYSPIATTTPIERLADRAASYAMPGIRIDGNDVAVVRATVAQAAERARAGDGPTLIEALTYRHKGHSRSDPATYRPPRASSSRGWSETRFCCWSEKLVGDGRRAFALRADP